MFIAYIQFNDSAVPTAHIPVYSDADDIYGRFVDISYPKVPQLSTRGLPISFSDHTISRL